jgi:imidazoleglycerol phosphate dehydratase HisB
VVHNINKIMTEIHIKILENKNDHHDITEILLKVALSTIKQTNKYNQRDNCMNLRDKIDNKISAVFSNLIEKI